ncbi:hypothetical protein F5Y14DRAFT_299711 [Nemania sp. NC0429]|nr:hypothetical protein F5Y14DRAFT_299711 [Nemania sp. NC0429]
MRQSWLLRYSLVTVAVTGEPLINNHNAKTRAGTVLPIIEQSPVLEELVSPIVMIPEAMGMKTGRGGLPAERPGPTGAQVESKALVLRIPRATAATPIRQQQDDDQINALSAQLQSLSQSATRAISSVSSSASSMLNLVTQSAQSVQRSADQAVQSANRAADQAMRQLSQTQSSASSAVSSVNARASSQISQSLASMSSRISANEAGAQSSASSAISSARAAASKFAASQIQAFRADATIVRGDTNSPLEQGRPSSVSISSLAIIIVVSIIGTLILSTVSSCLVLRCRRKRRSSHRAEAMEGHGKFDKRPIAVRGPPSPRFPGLSRDPMASMDDFRLPRLPLLRSKKSQHEARNSIGSAASLNEKSGGAKQPPIFRLQKTNGVTSATAIRLIRVGGEKGNTNTYTDIHQNIPAPRVATTSTPSQDAAFISASNQPGTQPPLRNNATITQPTKSPKSPSRGQRISILSTYSPDTENANWRSTRRIEKATSRDRFRFRDSSDFESSGSTPTDHDNTPPLNANTLSPRTPVLAKVLGLANSDGPSRTMSPN